MYATRPRVLIDEQEHVITWSEHEFRVRPGRHEISVYFPYTGSDRCGLANAEIEVMPGETITIEYRTPFLTTSSGKLRMTYPDK